MRVRDTNKTATLAKIREDIAKHKEKGRKIVLDLKRLQSHYEKMQEYYSTWEDEMDVIQRAIDKSAEEQGIPADQILMQAEEFDAVADLLGDEYA